MAIIIIDNEDQARQTIKELNEDDKVLFFLDGHLNSMRLDEGAELSQEIRKKFPSAGIIDIGEHQPYIDEDMRVTKMGIDQNLVSTVLRVLAKPKSPQN